MRISITKIASLLTLLLWMGTQAEAQEIRIAAGPAWHNASDTSAAAASFNTQVSLRHWYSELFQLQGSMTVQPAPSFEGAVLVRPLKGYYTVDPYVYLGYGMFPTEDRLKTVIPIGAGLDYPLSATTNLSMEVQGRWMLEKPENPSIAPSLVFNLFPSVGISYRFTHRKRPAPDIAEAPRAARQAELTQPVIVREPPPASPREITRRPSPFPAPKPEYLPPPVPDAPVIEIPGMVLLPAGMFVMGLTDEDPLNLQTAGRRRISVSEFYMDRYETSNRAYREFLDALTGNALNEMLPDSSRWNETGNRYSWQEYFRGTANQDHPVVGISWDQALAYCEWAHKRLPTEAEWEYAARAGHVGRIFPWDGFEPRDEYGRYLANYKPGPGAYALDGFAFTAPVNAFPPNDWGLFNMAGNVAEWILDAYTPSYSTLADFNPLHEDPNERLRVVRGGSWASDPFYIGVGVRDAMPRNLGTPYVGFRCVKDVETAREQAATSIDALRFE